jgi:hypothetical protein
VADVEKILKLVADGVLTPEEADEILSATGETPAALAGEPASEPAGRARHLRIEVSEGGRRVVNLRVPLNIAGLASAFLPGLSDEDAERIRTSIRAGIRGPIVDIDDKNGDRVLIVSE